MCNTIIFKPVDQNQPMEQTKTFLQWLQYIRMEGTKSRTRQMIQFENKRYLLELMTNGSVAKKQSNK